MDGIVNILKPNGMTSHDVVSFVRLCTRIKRVGHTGTLDPQAVGVLPICIGKATKAAEFLVDKNKIYRAELKLGIITDTQDSYGTVIEKHQVNISEEILKKVINDFQGEIEQIPPMYSAIKVKGQKLYELARKGIEVERKPRKVRIFEIKICDIDLEKNTVLMDIKCSKGTYIRTLCHDIGEKLGCGGHMSFLLRVQSGPFLLDEAVTVEQFEHYSDQGRVGQLLVSTDKVFLELPSVIVNHTGEHKVINGNIVKEKFFKKPTMLEIGKIYRVYNEQNIFLCLSQVIENNEHIRCLKLVKSFY